MAATVFASLAASLDGYIGSTNGDLAWLNDRMRPDEDYGMSETMTRAGAYIVGANTFREMSGFFGGTETGSRTFVVTSADPAEAPSGVTFHAGDLHALVEMAKAATDKDVYVFGGGDIVTQLIAINALDELLIALIPVVLGGGVKLFRELDREIPLRLVACRSFPSGIVQLRYERFS